MSVMRRFFGVTAVALLLMIPMSGCRAKVDQASAPGLEKLTLYSIDNDFPPGKEPKAKEKWLGYPVLKKMEVTDAGQRQKLITAFKDAYARRPKEGAECFWPRHGISTVENGKSVDYVICFECEWFSEFADGKKVRHEPINRDVQPIFDKILKGKDVSQEPPEVRNRRPSCRGRLEDEVDSGSRRGGGWGRHVLLARAKVWAPPNWSYRRLPEAK